MLFTNDLPQIEFQYPFNGCEIAKTLENAFKGKKNQDPEVIELIKSLRSDDQKINTLGDIRYQLMNLAVSENRSDRRESINIIRDKSVFSKNDYYDYYKSRFPSDEESSSEDELIG